MPFQQQTQRHSDTATQRPTFGSAMWQPTSVRSCVAEARRRVNAMSGVRGCVGACRAGELTIGGKLFARVLELAKDADRPSFAAG